MGGDKLLDAHNSKDHSSYFPQTNATIKTLINVSLFTFANSFFIWNLSRYKQVVDSWGIYKCKNFSQNKYLILNKKYEFVSIWTTQVTAHWHSQCVYNHVRMSGLILSTVIVLWPTCITRLFTKYAYTTVDYTGKQNIKYKAPNTTNKTLKYWNLLKSHNNWSINTYFFFQFSAALDFSEK